MVCDVLLGPCLVTLIKFFKPPGPHHGSTLCLAARVRLTPSEVCMCRLGVNCSWCHDVLSVPVMIYRLQCAVGALFSYTGQAFQIPEPHDGSTPRLALAAPARRPR